MSFVEACRILTDEYGVPIPYGKDILQNGKILIINWCKKRESTSDTFTSFLIEEVAEFIMEHTTLTKAGLIFARVKGTLK